MAGRSGSKRREPLAPALPDVTVAGVADDVVDEAQLSALHFDRVDLSGFEVADVDIEECRFASVDASGGHWERVTVANCRVDGGSLANLQVRGGNLRRCEVTDNRMTGLQWTDGVVRDVRFTRCRGDLAGFRFSRFTHVVFADCRLASIDFTGADLSGVAFVDCDLTGARLNEATMTGATLTNCRLEDVSGIGALRGATVSGVDMMSLAFQLAADAGITLVPLSRDGQEYDGVGECEEAVSLGWDGRQFGFAEDEFAVGPFQADSAGDDLKGRVAG